MELLKRALNDPDSPIYNSNNKRQIKKYLRRVGTQLSEHEIKEALESEISNEVTFNNERSSKIKQVSKPHLLRPKFFSILQSDVLILTSRENNRSYGTKNKYVLCVICVLSKWIFLESLPSLKFEPHKAAWIRIFARMKTVLNDAEPSLLITDAGSNYVSEKFRQFLKSVKVKLNIVKRRAYRGSTKAAMMIPFPTSAPLMR